jgi:toxin ParE1/3/4
MVEHLVLSPRATAEIATAYRWYEERNQGLGERFLDRLDACVLKIRRNPEFFEQISDVCRFAILRQFPYAVYFDFRKDEDLIEVYSVFHSSQNPTKLADRLPPAD